MPPQEAAVDPVLPAPRPSVRGSQTSPQDDGFARAGGGNIAVQAGLVAAVAEVGLRGSQPAAAQGREVGIEQQGQGVALRVLCGCCRSVG